MLVLSLHVSLERLVECGFFETLYEAIDCVGLAPGFGAAAAWPEIMFSVFVLACGAVVLHEAFDGDSGWI